MILEAVRSAGTTLTVSLSSCSRQGLCSRQWLSPGSPQVVYGLGAGQQTPQPLPGMKQKVMSLEAVAALGEAKPHAHQPPQPFHTATLCYTSGTTG